MPLDHAFDGAHQGSSVEAAPKTHVDGHVVCVIVRKLCKKPQALLSERERIACSTASWPIGLKIDPEGAVQMAGQSAECRVGEDRSERALHA